MSQLKVLFDGSSLQALLTAKCFSFLIQFYILLQVLQTGVPGPRYLQHIQISLGFTYTDSCNGLPQPLCRNSPATNLASVAFVYLGGGLYSCFTKVCTKPEPCDQRMPSSIAYWDRNLVPSRSHIYINFPLLLL